MFFDSSLTPKFKKAVKTREEILLIESLNAMVKDTRLVLCNRKVTLDTKLSPL